MVLNVPSVASSAYVCHDGIAAGRQPTLELAMVQDHSPPHDAQCLGCSDSYADPQFPAEAS